MQLDRTAPYRSDSPTPCEKPTSPSSKKRFKPDFPTLQHTNPKKRRLIVNFKVPLALDAATGTTRLHVALQEGEYDQAIALLRKHCQLNVKEQHTGWTPLHCLFCCRWARNEFFILLDLLMKGGCSPSAKSNIGKTFLDLIAGGSDFGLNEYKEIFEKIDLKQFRFYTPGENLPSFLLETAEARHFGKDERLGIIMEYFSYILEENRQEAAEKLFLQITDSSEFADGEMEWFISNLLKSFGPSFDPCLVKDPRGRNLFYAVLNNPYLRIEEICKIAGILKDHNVNINSIGPKHPTTFEFLIEARYLFKTKIALLKGLLDVGLECTTTVDADAPSLPSHFIFIDYLLGCDLDGKKVREVMQTITGMDVYREFLLLKLIANCFSLEEKWVLEDGAVNLPGSSTRLTDFYSWIEDEALQFYTNNSESKGKTIALLRDVSKIISSDAQSAIQQISYAAWKTLLEDTGLLLSRSYYYRRTREETIDSLLDSKGRFAFLPSLATTDANSRHVVGLFFKPPEVLFCNKGDDLSKISGVSRHSFSQKRINKIFKEAREGTQLYRFITDHFPDRFKKTKVDKSPFIARQKSQTTGNCPVASFSSLELSLLITLISEAAPEAKESSVNEIARAIKTIHRKERRKKVLSEYEQFHSNEDSGMSPDFRLLGKVKELHPDYFAPEFMNGALQ